jgi:glycosyltransferase involved in cell wall biosynthesis
LRILHIGKFYPPHAGGIERHLFDLAQAQVASGLEVTCLVHASPGIASASSLGDPRVRVVRVPCHGQRLFVPVSPAWPRYLQRCLREFRPDLLHVHVPNPSTFWSLLLPSARRVPMIVHWHADIPLDARHAGLRWAYRPYRVFESALNARAARIVATSAAYLEASHALTAHRSKCEVIPLGLADAGPVGATPQWPAPGMKLLAVGRLSYYKGFDVLLDALAHLPEVSLLLVGDGECRERLEAQADRLGLRARVRFAGQLDDAALEAAYRACDAFCLPSVDRAEAFGMVLLEAMRAGKPVIASDIPGSGVGTVVVAERTGKLVAPRDAAALADALRELAAAPDRRRDMGLAGLARWQRDYRIDAVTSRWTQTYRAVLDAPRAG